MRYMQEIKILILLKVFKNQKTLLKKHFEIIYELSYLILL